MLKKSSHSACINPLQLSRRFLPSVPLSVPLSSGEHCRDSPGNVWPFAGLNSSLQCSVGTSPANSLRTPRRQLAPCMTCSSRLHPLWRKDKHVRLAEIFAGETNKVVLKIPARPPLPFCAPQGRRAISYNTPLPLFDRESVDSASESVSKRS